MEDGGLEAPQTSLTQAPGTKGALLSAAAMRRVEEMEDRSFNVRQQHQLRKRQQHEDNSTGLCSGTAGADDCAKSPRGDKRRVPPHEATEGHEDRPVSGERQKTGAKARPWPGAADGSSGVGSACATGVSASPRRDSDFGACSDLPHGSTKSGSQTDDSGWEIGKSSEAVAGGSDPSVRQRRTGAKLLEIDLDQAHGKKYGMDFPHAGEVQLHRRRKNDLHAWVEQLLRCQPLRREEVLLLCELLKDTLKSEPNCVTVPTPVTVAGDIHGQFYDLLELFRVGGKPPNTSYLFLGDYVDRGFYSVEVFCLMAAFKVLYPRKIFLLRGNHESRGITQVYGFYDECARKYGDGFNAVWTALTEAFDYLPLTAVIGSECFCDHGGLSKHLMTIDAIQAIDRFQEPPQEGGMCDLLWSDPYDSSMFLSDLPQSDSPGDGVLAVTAGDPLGGGLDEDGWAPSSRGAGMLWGPTVTDQFLHLNGVGCICRAHQLAQDGYQWCHNDKVCTVFSAPNYCYRCGNQASLMIVNDDLERSFVKFGQAPERGEPQQVRSLPDYFL
uniref:Serine/threonine-protein phosphatase n=1 Tax=Toxoplasma gondii COUG TaxID=1074873 RepID=A0A2G8XWT0_TOXGO|nr:putative serine/threonine-protein phosphatase 2A catalytic subunit beta isoform [Toxoplasma gondii COUG]